ncbi:MAG: imelysin family protein [Alphaproteobacteria bacterium]|nr:imelysin family protein [Alphaproteobacteria bacterium]
MARTAGSWLSWGVIAGLALLAAAPPVGCVPDDPGTTPIVDFGPVLEATGPAVVVPTLQTFADRAEALTTALDAWRAALEADTDGLAEREAARDAWHAAMDVWQEAEVMQIGPAAPSLTAALGEDLRDEIYSWPTVNPCLVDQKTVEAAWDSPSFFADNLVNSYGLDAIEHVLWAGPDNTCPGQVPINADGSWAALGESGVALNRAWYAVAMSAEVERQTGALLGRWTGDFSPATSYGSDQEALNEVFDALFYLELVTQDRKVAEPLGAGDCTTGCIELVEALPSGTSNDWIAANLRGFRALFTGGDAPGIEDLLREVGHDALADQVLAELDQADADVAALGAPLEEALMTNAGQVTVVFEQLKAVTNLLEGDVATVLALTIPSEAAGDAD